MKIPGMQMDKQGKHSKSKSSANSIMKKIKLKHSGLKRALAPVRRRYMVLHMLQYLSAGVLSALAVLLILSGLSFLFPFENLWYACLIAGLSTTALMLIIGWIKRPSAYEVAGMADKLGLQEKVTTACELDGREDAIARLQRQDTIDSLARLDKKRISLRIPKTHIYALIALMLAFVALNLIPNPMDRLIQQRQVLRAEMEKQLEELKKTQEQPASQEAMTDEQRQELAKLVEELAEQLKKTRDYKEALKEISRTEEKLAALADKIREGSIGQLSGQLGSLQETGALAKALKDRNLHDLEAELDKLKQQLEHGENREELAEKLKEALEKAAESMEEGKIRDNLVAASGSLGSGQAGAAADQLGEAVKQAMNAGSTLGDAKYALQQMRSSITRAAGEAQYAQNPGNRSGQNINAGSQNNGSQNKANSNSNNPGQGNKPGQSGGSSGSGQGQGRGQRQGQGAGHGQGNSGQSGSGVGTGTTNNSPGQGGSGTTGRQNGNNQMGDENALTVYERIYAPERLGNGGEITHVPGQLTGEGDITRQDDGRDIGNLSGFIPYKDVYQEYRDEAMNSMDRRILPPNIQEMVRLYFDALGQ